MDRRNLLKNLGYVSLSGFTILNPFPKKRKKFAIKLTRSFEAQKYYEVSIEYIKDDKDKEMIFEDFSLAKSYFDKNKYKSMKIPSIYRIYALIDKHNSTETSLGFTANANRILNNQTMILDTNLNGNFTIKLEIVEIKKGDFLWSI